MIPWECVNAYGSNSVAIVYGRNTVEAPKWIINSLTLIKQPHVCRVPSWETMSSLHVQAY